MKKVVAVQTTGKCYYAEMCYADFRRLYKVASPDGLMEFDKYTANKFKPVCVAKKHIISFESKEVPEVVEVN